MAERRLLRIGGSSLTVTPALVFSVANNLSQLELELDDVAPEKSSSSSSVADQPYHVTLPEILTVEERRASLVDILNKLLLLSSRYGIRPQLPNLICQILNHGPLSLEPLIVNVTPEEQAVLNSSLNTLDGICAIIDHGTCSLSIVADLVAALSCEASKAKCSTALNKYLVVDSKTSHSKDRADVARDLGYLLNDSKLVGKNDLDFVLSIPLVHGRLREELRNLRSITTRNITSSCAADKVERMMSLSSLVDALTWFGKLSLKRAQANVDAVEDESFSSQLTNVLMDEKNCPTSECLGKSSVLVFGAAQSEQYTIFLHLVYCHLGMVRTILSWEMAMAVLSLESAQLLTEKKKVLGKGTHTIMLLIKERLQRDLEVEDGLDNVFARLKMSADCCQSILSPKDREFDGLVQRIKLLNCNEIRRLPKIPKGTRDFAKEQMVAREAAFATITGVFKRHGAMALDTPVFELRETLMGKYGEDSKLIYDLADQGGELCSLRYDLTVPFARYMAMNKLKSYRRYQIAKVYRRDNTSKGRYREFYQCDFDIAGEHGKMAADFEVVRVLTELLDELNIGDYEVKMNHRKLLDGLLDICGVPQEMFRTICSSIDKLDKLSPDQVKREMVYEKGLSMETADKIWELVKEKGRPLELLTKLKQDGSKFSENQESVIALNELEILFKALDRSKCALDGSKCIDKVVFDLSLARGLDYYSGVIFEAVFKGTTKVGSIAAGGRYDNLISKLGGGEAVPAVGVSLGIERVFDIMEQQQLKNGNAKSSETQVLVSILGDDLSLAAELVSELWNAEIKAEFMLHKKIMEHIKRATKQKIPFMVIVGKDEMNNAVVKVKDLDKTREQTFPRNLMVEELKMRLS
ncbi:hypothetical protein V2J09_011524 [Rumex salicifolius]